MLSLKLRLLVAVVVLLAAGAVLLVSRPRLRQHALPDLPSFRRAAPWFEEQRSRWRTYSYVDIADAAELREAVRRWVQARPSGPAIDEDLLAADIMGFLQGLAEREADAYVRRVAGLRLLGPDPANDAFVQACYYEMTGRTLPRGASALKVMREFWHGHPAAVPRPVSVSQEAYLEVAWSRPLSACAEKTGIQVDLPSVWPSFSVLTDPAFRRWMAPTSRALIRLTEPRRSLAEVVRRHDTALLAIFGCVVRAADGTLGLLHATMYFCPDDGAWQVSSAATEFDRHVYWAM